MRLLRGTSIGQAPAPQAPPRAWLNVAHVKRQARLRRITATHGPLTKAAARTLATKAAAAHPITHIAPGKRTMRKPTPYGE